MRYEFNLQKVKGVMVENGMTQGDVAKLLGLSQTGLSLKFNGKAEFKASEISALATRFKVSPDIFFNLIVDKLETNI